MGRLGGLSDADIVGNSPAPRIDWIRLVFTAGLRVVRALRRAAMLSSSELLISGSDFMRCGIRGPGSTFTNCVMISYSPEQMVKVTNVYCL